MTRLAFIFRATSAMPETPPALSANSLLHTKASTADIAAMDASGGDAPALF